MYAIFRALGKQFRAEKGQVLRLPRLAEAPGTTVTFDEVLLTSDGETVKTGAPTVKGAKVGGMLPAGLQNYVTYAATIPSASKNADAAKAFLAALNAPPAKSHWDHAGFEQLAGR